MYSPNRHPHTLEARYTVEDSRRSSGNNEVYGMSQGVRVVARDNARHQAHSRSLRTLSTNRVTDDNSSTHSTMAESSSGNDYMIVVDYYSMLIEILHFSNTITTACIAKLKDIFAQFGIPTELVSDNPPQFSSSESKSFAEQCGFTHVTSSPYLPIAN